MRRAYQTNLTDAEWTCTSLTCPHRSPADAPGSRFARDPRRSSAPPIMGIMVGILSLCFLRTNPGKL